MVKRSNKEEFITKAKKIHGDIYNYSKVIYVNNKTKVIIVCPEHGEFLQVPNMHIHSSKPTKCPECVGKRRWTKNIFIREAKKFHGDLYDYSKVVIVNSKTNVEIICPQHGSFEQILEVHLRCGCPHCARERTESQPVKEIKEWLDARNIVYECEKIFDGCKNKRHLPFDFYIPHKNLLIEFDGKFHFFGWNQREDLYLKQQKNDQIKNEFVSSNDLNLVRISYTENHISILEKIFVE